MMTLVVRHLCFSFSLFFLCYQYEMCGTELHFDFYDSCFMRVFSERVFVFASFYLVVFSFILLLKSTTLQERKMQYCL